MAAFIPIRGLRVPRSNFSQGLPGCVRPPRERCANSWRSASACPVGASSRGLLDKVCVTARVPGGRARGERASERGVSSGRFLVGRRARAQRASGRPLRFGLLIGRRERVRARALSCGSGTSPGRVQSNAPALQVVLPAGLGGRGVSRSWPLGPLCNTCPPLLNRARCAALWRRRGRCLKFVDPSR